MTIDTYPIAIDNLNFYPIKCQPYFSVTIIQFQYVSFLFVFDFIKLSGKSVNIMNKLYP